MSPEGMQQKEILQSGPEKRPGNSLEVHEDERFAEIAKIPLDKLLEQQEELKNTINAKQAEYKEEFERGVPLPESPEKLASIVKAKTLYGELQELRPKEALMREYLKTMIFKPEAPVEDPDANHTVQ